MDGLLIITAMLVLLVFALGPAHRRAAAWRPGLDRRNDRDHHRLLDEVALLGSFEDEARGGGSPGLPESAREAGRGRPEDRRGELGQAA